MKVSQSSIHYQPDAKDGQDCDECYQFVAPGSLQLVDGEVSPQGLVPFVGRRTGLINNDAANPLALAHHLKTFVEVFRLQ